MEKEPKVAIVILNWNGFDDTVECLDSIKEMSGYANYRVVLVDNGSAKSEGARLKEKFPGIHLISNSTNRGFAGGNNDGIKWALENAFEYIVNLNNDCIVGKDWLIRLMGGMLSTKADFGTLRIMYYPETDLICSDGDAFLIDGSGIAINHLGKVSSETGPSQIRSACGAGSIYSIKSLLGTELEKNEFFDKLYFAYHEDIDLGIRLNARSRRGVLVPDAVIYHKGTQTAGFRSAFHQFQMEKNRLLTMMLNYPVWLIIPGELFHFFKLVARRIYRTFNKARVRRTEENMPGITGSIKVMVQARIWILRNFRSILKDRKLRKKKGFIKGSIAGHFYWDLARIFTC